MAEPNGNGNGNGTNRLLMLVSAAMAAWSFLIGPYLDRSKLEAEHQKEVAGLTSRYLEREVATLESTMLRRTADGDKRLDALENRITGVINRLDVGVEAEKARNNRIERELGGLEQQGKKP